MQFRQSDALAREYVGKMEGSAHAVTLPFVPTMKEVRDTPFANVDRLIKAVYAFQERLQAVEERLCGGSEANKIGGTAGPIPVTQTGALPRMGQEASWAIDVLSRCHASLDRIQEMVP